MTYYLNGLDCANCAAKIEDAVRGLSGVASADVNFMTRKLKVEWKADAGSRASEEKIREIVRKIEPELRVEPYEKQPDRSQIHAHEESVGRWDVIKIAAGIVVLVGALLLPAGQWGKFALYLASLLITGGSVFLRAAKNIAKGKVFDENFLMGIATVGAFAVGEYAEGVAVMLFYQVGELMQSYAVGRSRKNISALMDIRPEYANVKRGGETEKVSPDAVSIGETIVVRPGERVPLDGVVEEGMSALDTRALTGESLPREIGPGEAVLSGCVNTSGMILVRVTKTSGESAVAKILEMVENAGDKKAKSEQFITKFARVYTPIVVGIAALLAILPPLVLGGGFSDWIYRALIFLVISCPCALVISVPLSFFAGIGGASRKGILIKGSNYMEDLAHTNTVVFDKTGTLTKGVLRVREIETAGIEREELLHFTAYAEYHSSHPIAKAVLTEYGQDIGEDRIEAAHEIAGMGVEAKVSGRRVLAGNGKLMQKYGIAYEEKEAAGTVLYIALDEKYAGRIIISDEIREDAKAALARLKKSGVQNTVMLTGDTEYAAREVAQELGIDAYFAQLLPGDKAERVEALKGRHAGKVAFVGDGINDAPVLATADIGFAMGGIGADAAIEAADVVIMTDEPSKIASAIAVARKTLRIALQNIAFALAMKGFFLLLGAFGIATMWEAVFADVGVSVLAILNALRAFYTREG